MLQMLTQSFVEVLKEWHEDTACSDIFTNLNMRIDFAGLVKHLPDTLGCSEAWQYFLKHGLKVCSVLLGLAAQQSLNEIDRTGQWRCLTLDATVSYLRFLSKLQSQMIVWMCG